MIQSGQDFVITFAEPRLIVIVVEAVDSCAVILFVHDGACDSHH